MQPKKIDCTEKNLHTFIDKATEKAKCYISVGGGRGRLRGAAQPAGTAKPGNAEKAHLLRSYIIQGTPCLPTLCIMHYAFYIKLQHTVPSLFTGYRILATDHCPLTFRKRYAND